LAEKGYDPELGARPLRRVIQQEIEDILSEKILFKDFRAGQTIVIDCVENEGVKELTFEAVEGLPPSVDFDATPSV
jgi:ATP-dependent Clp protease ATP-binding subunit ClpC